MVLSPCVLVDDYQNLPVVRSQSFIIWFFFACLTSFDSGKALSLVSEFVQVDHVVVLLVSWLLLISLLFLLLLLVVLCT